MGKAPLQRAGIDPQAPCDLVEVDAVDPAPQEHRALRHRQRVEVAAYPVGVTSIHKNALTLRT